MNRKKYLNPISFEKRPPFIRLLGLLLLTIIFLVVYNLKIENDILANGLENSAIVEFCDYKSFIDNAKAQNRISYYNIKFYYFYNGNRYESEQEILVNDFMENIGYELHKGDKLNVRHSRENPQNVRIERQ